MVSEGRLIQLPAQSTAKANFKARSSQIAGEQTEGEAACSDVYASISRRQEVGIMCHGSFLLGQESVQLVDRGNCHQSQDKFMAEPLKIYLLMEDLCSDRKRLGERSKINWQHLTQ